MKKCILTIVLSSLVFVSSWAQYEDIKWQVAGGGAQYGLAHAGLASYYLTSSYTGAYYTNNYTLSKDTVFLTDNFSHGAVCSSTAIGKYLLSISNDTLTYVLISDACPTRLGQLAGTKWVHYLAPLDVDATVISSQIKVFPNPTTGIVNIQVPVENAHLLLFDSKGAQVIEKTLHAMDNAISLASLQKGMYHAQISMNGELLKKTSIVVE
jgi:hypothetical protein